MSPIPSNFPLVRSLPWNGDHDRVYELLILCGPLVIGAIALFGRSVLTTAFAAGYIVVFVLYLLWIGISS
ncbi:hypothetical protein [Halocatena salina]|uniref:Uncharacterized protein n=1 Tax=Halocatena salina TaxID=2934340 RepID=A0A8U0A0G7_9EURY|nr:hypothetical protein [Halocatena salina]UPM42631.1 hypothetical protein MW046_11790 [Halocatena salina]